MTDEELKMLVELDSPNLPALVPSNAEILHKATVPFDFTNPPVDPPKLFALLKKCMIEYGGWGLSANQVGIPYSVFVFGNKDEPDGISGVFNPKIVHEEDYRLNEEGCLSFPGLILKIKRPYIMRVRYTTHNGVTDTAKFQNLTARIFHHEIDHLNGIVFTKRASRYHLDLGNRRLKKLLRTKQNV